MCVCVRAPARMRMCICVRESGMLELPPQSPAVIKGLPPSLLPQEDEFRQKAISLMNDIQPPLLQQGGASMRAPPPPVQSRPRQLLTSSSVRKTVEAPTQFKERKGKNRGGVRCKWVGRWVDGQVVGSNLPAPSGA